MSAWFDHLAALGYAPLVPGDDFPPSQALAVALTCEAGLPDGYAQFLSRFPVSGVFESASDVYFPAPQHQAAHGDAAFFLNYLIAASSDPQTDVLALRRRQLAQQGGVLPLHLLQVGEDLGGNRFVLDLRRGEGFGQVLFCDHEQAEPLRLAPDFLSFLAGLRH